MTGRLSPLLERLRVRRAARLIRDGESVLDVGCGRAPLLTTLLESGKRRVQYFGIDRLADCTSTNQQHYPEHRFREAEVSQDTDLGFDERFDVIAMLAVIEHLPDPQAALGRMAKLLTGRGRLIITTPCRGTERLHALGARIGFCSREASEEYADVFPDLAFFQQKALACGLRLDHYERFLLGLNQLGLCPIAIRAGGYWIWRPESLGSTQRHGPRQRPASFKYVERLFQPPRMAPSAITNRRRGMSIGTSRCV